MLVTFKSKAAADVLMYEEHAKPILDVLGKEVQRGIITAAEMPQAISRLETEIAESRLRSAAAEAARAEQAGGEDADGGPEDKRSEPVSFATRAYPLLDMLRAAHQHGRDVMWGV